MRDGKVCAIPATPHRETAAKGEKKNERRAHSEKNDRCGHTREKKKRAAKPNVKRCV